MKILDVDWLGFIDDLEHWHDLAVEDRIDLLSPKPLFGSSALDRLKSGFRDRQFLFGSAPAARDRIAIDRRCQDFLRLLRALDANRGLLEGTRDQFNEYISNYLSNGEKLSIGDGLGNPSAGFREYFENIATESWVKQFLGGGADWEKKYLSRGGRAYFSDPEVLKAARLIVGECYQQAQPILFDELEDRYGNYDPELIEEALFGSFRYLLLYPWLEFDNREPLFGVWPGIIHRKLVSRKEPPRPVEPETSHDAPFLMDDMTTLLVACAAEPLRLRANDGEIFANDQKKIASNLSDLPQWIEDTFHFDSEARIRQAAYFLLRTRFADREDTIAGDRRLRATAEGIKWLGMRSDQRLRQIFDLLKTPEAMDEMPASESRYGVAFLPVMTRLYSASTLITGVAAGVRNQYREVPGDAFVLLGDFCEYQARHNPISPEGAQRRISGEFGFEYIYSSTQESFERKWAGLLMEFFRLRLLPLGAAEAGYTPERALCIRLTRLGKYLLGTEEEFHWSGDQGSLVIVQPNFEVVFLGPSPMAEAEISRFAERKGKQMGVMFTITKKSVINGAAAGLSAKTMVETLQRVCGKEVPANVSREIEGWAATCRRVDMGPATLIRCPDAETAMRIQAAAPDAINPLSDTVLELNGRIKPLDMARKLRAMGIFL